MALFFFFNYLFTFSNSSQGAEQTNKIPAKYNLAVGDLIFRAGTGYESQIIQKLSGSTWSHLGVVVAVEPKIQIIHATTDDRPEQLNQVIQSTLAEFTDKRLALTWKAYRIKSLTLVEREILITELKKQLGQPFILGAADEPHRYCTTLIADALPIRLSQKLLWTETSFIGFQGQLLYPHAFLQLESLVSIDNSQ
ncbi:YiiX/YebB-like N1pC/P60 family cysteine hydrolase [Pseudomonas sp. F1_0610]|uniref:YiiX/YebB-like N1pC/P60 family cysteine hydrolase n=1 Tax=Pseudomonas sp. F1_0610 TaxID=3114284 RepID=UPI0039C0C837